MRAYLVFALAATAATAATLLAGAPAQALPKLVSSTPAEAATAAKLTKIELKFSEPLAAGSLTPSLVMTSMPGMSHHSPMTIAGFKTALAADRKAAVITLPRALPAGAYHLTWQAKSAQGQPAKGELKFSAR